MNAREAVAPADALEAEAAGPGPYLRVVALGGGTGLPVVLRGLAGRPGVAVTAVVAMADDGGSSGRLRRSQGALPPGDVRNCLVALAGRTRAAELFQHRFRGNGALRGHALGNLWLAAEAERTGNFLAAVNHAGELLGARGGVIPSTLTPVRLWAKRDEGPPVVGQRRLARGEGRIRSVELQPSAPRAAPGVLNELARADLVVLGPGSLFSSVLPPLLVAGVADALRGSGAVKVWVANLVTQRGETCGMDAADHLAALREHVGRVVDVALLNGTPLPVLLQDRYARKGSLAVEVDEARVRAEGVVPVPADLLSPGNRARHCPERVARALLALSVPRAAC